MATDVVDPVTAAKRPRRSRRIAFIALSVVVAVLVLALWGVIEARRIAAVAPEIEAARDALRADLEEQQWAQARADGERLAEAAGTARAAAESVPLRLASFVPVLGRNVAAVRTLAAALDEVASEAMQPLLITLEQGPVPVTADGAIDVSALRQVAPQLVAAHSVISDAANEVGELEPEALIPPLRPKVEQAQQELNSLADRTRTLSATVSALPAVLGADGPRRYLLGS